MGQEIAKHQPRVSDEPQQQKFVATPKNLYGTIPQKDFYTSDMDSLTNLFENLAALSPHHKFIDKTTFVHYFPLDGILAERLFTAFDQDKNGVIDVKEFLGGLALCLDGSLDDKYKVVFDMFNLDGSDGVSAYELELVLKSMMPAAAKILRARDYGQCYSSSTAELELLVNKIVQDAFEQCDLGKSGKLTWVEFKRWMAKHPFVLDSVFNHASMVDKQFQYSRLKERQKMKQSNSRDVMRAPAGVSELRSQTWVNDEGSHLERTGESARGFTGSYAGADYLWSPVFAANSALPCARSKHAACLFDGAVFVLGGRSASGSLKDFWRYDPASNTWSHVVAAGETKPPSLQEHSVVARKRKFYVFGGEFTSSSETPLWIFDLNELLWNKHGSRTKGPVNRRSHSAVCFEDAMFIFGGFIDLRGATSELWKYEFDSCSWARLEWQSNDCPSPRYCHSAVVHDRAMWVFGGLEGLQAKNELWRLSLDFYTWSRIRGRGGPPGLFGHSATVVGDGMLIFGGETSDGSLVNTLWRFDFESRSWATIRPRGKISPPVRAGHTMLSLPASAFHACARPTTSRSDPPPTPRPGALLLGNDNRPSSSPSVTGEVNFVAGEGTHFDRSVANATPSAGIVKTFGSLGSLASVEIPHDAECRPYLPRPASADSIVSSVERTLPAVRAPSPLVKVSYDLVDIEPLHCSQPVRTGAEVTSASAPRTQTLPDSRGQSLLVQMYKPRRAGTEGGLPPRGEGVKAVHGRLQDVTSQPAQAMERGVMCALVMGGKLKNSVDMYGRTLDTWKCVVDPVKSNGERVHKIVVERNQESRPREPPRPEHAPYERLTRDAHDADWGECVLSDVVDGDTCSVDLLLDDDGCARPSAAPGNLQHFSNAGSPKVSI